MKKKKKKKRAQLIIVERAFYHHKKWKALSAAAKIFYGCLKGNYAGYNNGEIELPYTAMRGIVGCSSKDAVAKAIKELEKEGFIKINQFGGLYRFSNLYELTFKWDHYDGGTINKSKYDKK